MDNGLRAQGYRWSAYSDPGFEHELGKEFRYTNLISSDGWISYVTKGIFPNDVSYLKLEAYEQNTNLTMFTWYFRFKKGYQMSLDGRTFVVDNVSGKRVVLDGQLTQVQLVEDPKTHQRKMKRVSTVLKRDRVSLLENSSDIKVGDKVVLQVPLFSQVRVHYVEEPTIVFFITPPHLKSFARIILILINQMFNMQVDESYLTLPSQKPFYKTKYMIDEAGNLSSNGSGIPDLQTKTSIGLAQGQYFTLILQTLAQLEDVYGKNINSILQGNVGNILYIKSTDDSMLQILEQLSGKIHRIEHDSQTISNDMYKVFNRTDGKLSNNRTVREVPVISKNDMLQVVQGDLMVFGKKGGNPVWNTNQCAMPYSFMLLDDNPLLNFENPQKYSLQTVPTTANTMDFNLLSNIPDFEAMVNKRVDQAKLAPRKLDLYKQNHKKNGISLTTSDLRLIDSDELAIELMRSINEQLVFDKQSSVGNTGKDGNGNVVSTDDLVSPEEAAEKFANSTETASGSDETMKKIKETAEENTEMLKANDRQDAKANESDKAIFANGTISQHDLLYDVPQDIKNVLGAAYMKLIDQFRKGENLPEGLHVDEQGNLRMGNQIMIKNLDGANSQAQKQFGEDGESTPDLGGLVADDQDKLFQEGDELATHAEVQPAWLQYLAYKDSWQDILDGQYDQLVGTFYASK